MSRKIMRVLWTGASFVPDEHVDVTTDMVNHHDTGLEIVSVKKTKGGTRLRWQIDENELISSIESGNFDYVFINEIELAVNTRDREKCDAARESIGEIVGAVKKTNAKLIWYCTWLMEKTFESDFDLFVQHYKELIAKYGGTFAPLGFAWKNAWKKESEETLKLYKSDRNHASPRGMYLGACVMYGLLTGKSPVGDAVHRNYWVPSKPGNTPSITDERAAFLQEVAWETVREFME